MGFTLNVPGKQGAIAPSIASLIMPFSAVNVSSPVRLSLPPGPCVMINNRTVHSLLFAFDTTGATGSYSVLVDPNSDVNLQCAFDITGGSVLSLSAATLVGASVAAVPIGAAYAERNDDQYEATKPSNLIPGGFVLLVVSSLPILVSRSYKPVLPQTNIVGQIFGPTTQSMNSATPTTSDATLIATSAYQGILAINNASTIFDITYIPPGGQIPQTIVVPANTSFFLPLEVASLTATFVDAKQTVLAFGSALYAAEGGNP